MAKQLETATLPGVEEPQGVLVSADEVGLIRQALNVWAKSLSRASKAEEEQLIKAIRTEQFEKVMKLYYRFGGSAS